MKLSLAHSPPSGFSMPPIVTTEEILANSAGSLRMLFSSVETTAPLYDNCAR